MQVPADYEKSFKQADETFLYQLVFDPVSRSLVPLNELPEGVQLGDLEFAGPYPCAAVINLIIIAGFDLGFPRFEKKKCRIKFTLARQMGRTKLCPRISTYIF